MKWLFQPYPYRPHAVPQAIRYSVGEGVFLFFFLYFFEPFGIQQWESPTKVVHLMGFGVLTSLGTLTYRLFLPRLFPVFFQEKSWVIWKEILGILTLIGIITAFNLAYGTWYFGWRYSVMRVVHLYLGVMSISFFPVVFWTLIDYTYQLKKYSMGVAAPQTPIPQTDRVTLTDEFERNQWTMSVDSIWALESSDNYCTLYFQEEGSPKQVLIRTSLIRMEQQLAPFSVFYRCHRSYIANFSQVKEVKGNAQGYFLHFHHTDLVVPVARKYSYLVESLKKK